MSDKEKRCKYFHILVGVRCLLLHTKHLHLHLVAILHQGSNARDLLKEYHTLLRILQFDALHVLL